VPAGLVVAPEAGPWSSSAGAFHRRDRRDGVAYDAWLGAWAGEFGRTDPEASYRRFVTAGRTVPPRPPWADARHGWILGSERFVERLRGQIPSPQHRDLRREERLLRGVDLERVLESVCQHDGVDRALIATRGSRSPARAALADLARESTEARHAELVPLLGVSRPERVPNLSRRLARWLEHPSRARQDLVTLETSLGLRKKTKNSVRPQESPLVRVSRRVRRSQ
jgi:hypothetical protein